MLRFLLFYGKRYYMKGGMYEFISDHSTQDECLWALDKLTGNDPYMSDWYFHWFGIYDTYLRRYVIESPNTDKEFDKKSKNKVEEQTRLNHIRIQNGESNIDSKNKTQR